jgi:chitosanase
MVERDRNGSYVVLTDIRVDESHSDPWRIAKKYHGQVNLNEYYQALLAKNEQVHGREKFNSKSKTSLENLPNGMKIYLPDDHVPVSSTSHFPFNDMPGNMDIEQCDTIMSIVSIAENSTTRWWDNYGYCENIGDGRGMTVSLVGFCSGTGDLLWVFQQLQQINNQHPLLRYLRVLQMVNGTNSTQHLHTLEQDLLKYQNDADWRKAVWRGILHFYWRPAMQFATGHSLHLPITKGFLFDLALHHGADAINRMADMVRTCAGGEADEQRWLMEMIAVRKNIIQQSQDLGPTDRCDMWYSILRANNLYLQRPLRNLCCYGDTFQIEK